MSASAVYQNSYNTSAGLNDSSRNSAPRSFYEERMSALRPASLQIINTSGSHGRSTPCSRNSSFGRATGGASGSGSGGSRASRSGGGGGMLVPLPPPPPLTGTPRTREKYILLDEIGRGGGGTVHKAIHVPSMRLVAVKMVQVHDDEKRRQMYKELKTLLSMKPVRGKRVGGERKKGEFLGGSDRNWKGGWRRVEGLSEMFPEMFPQQMKRL